MRTRFGRQSLSRKKVRNILDTTRQKVTAVLHSQIVAYSRVFSQVLYGVSVRRSVRWETAENKIGISETMSFTGSKHAL